VAALSVNRYRVRKGRSSKYLDGALFRIFEIPNRRISALSQEHPVSKTFAIQEMGQDGPLGKRIL